MHPNAEMVIGAMTAFNAGNFDALASLTADDAEWIYGGRSPLAGHLHGKAEVAAWLRQANQAGAVIHPAGVLASDRYVIVFNDMTSGPGDHRITTTEAFCVAVNDAGQMQKFYQLSADQDAVDASLAEAAASGSS